jgi:hypothetical protein
MEQPNILLQRVAEDLATVRRAIEKAEQSETGARPGPVAVGLSVHFLIVGLVLAGVFLVADLAFDAITQPLLLSVYSPELQHQGVLSIGFMLLLLVSGVYALAWTAARKQGESFDTYAVRNFFYLRNLSFLCDVLVKYAAFCLLVLAKQPQWIAPLFLVFIGDWLIQGKVFILPVNRALVLGFAAIVLGGAQFAFGIGTVIWPLTAFIIVSALSLIHLRTGAGK